LNSIIRIVKTASYFLNGKNDKYFNNSILDKILSTNKSDIYVDNDFICSTWNLNNTFCSNSDDYCKLISNQLIFIAITEKSFVEEKDTLPVFEKNDLIHDAKFNSYLNVNKNYDKNLQVITSESITLLNKKENETKVSRANFTNLNNNDFFEEKENEIYSESSRCNLRTNVNSPFDLITKDRYQTKNIKYIKSNYNNYSNKIKERPVLNTHFNNNTGATTNTILHVNNNNFKRVITNTLSPNQILLRSKSKEYSESIRHRNLVSKFNKQYQDELSKRCCLSEMKFDKRIHLKNIKHGNVSLI
jgi:hypothetical protein